MKLATYRSGRSTAIGIVDAGAARIFDIAAAARRDGASDAFFASMLALIDADDAGLDLAPHAARQAWRRGGSLGGSRGRRTAGAACPSRGRCATAMSFERHIRQSARGSQALQARAPGRRGGVPRGACRRRSAELEPVYREIPIYYITNRFTVVGPDATVLWPRYSEVMDYELEVGIVTRRTRAEHPGAARRPRISSAIRSSTIFPRAIGRDWRCRADSAPPRARASTASNVLGPWIVTPDELGDPQTLRVEVRVNGETRASGDTSGMLFSFEQILAYASQDETIHAGEFFGSGTVGNCCGLEIGRFLESGDTIELHVDRIGVLRNKVLRQGAV